MRVACFYHLYAGGSWREPTSEWLAALAKAGFDGELHVGIVGPERERLNAARFLFVRAAAPVITAADEQGFEQLTIHRLHDWAIANPNTAVLYAHTKGAGYPSTWEDQWRRSMTCALLGDWQENLAALDDHDAVGSHWLTAGEFPGAIEIPIFGGNFWLARSDYLAALPACSTASRHEAEAWLGRGDPPPTVLDLRPGWPGPTNCITRAGWP